MVLEKAELIELGDWLDVGSKRKGTRQGCSSVFRLRN